VKSLLLLNDIFQSQRVGEIFAQPQYEVDRYFFGARDAAQNHRDDVSRIVDKLHARQYDAVILENAPTYWNPRKSPWRNAARLLKRAADLPSLLGFERIVRAIPDATPLYLLDGMDRTVIDNAAFRFLPRCTRYYKRELPSNIINAFLYTTAKAESPDGILRSATFRAWAEKLRPISLGISDEKFRAASAIEVEKTIDVFFAGEFRGRPVREAGRAALQQLQADGFRIHISEDRYPEEQFHTLCAQSLLCWSPEGFGADCYRHYEIGACGSVPLRKHTSILPYAPMRDGVECFYYIHETFDLYDVARRALADRDRLRQIGLQARQRVHDFHRFSTLAQYILGE
jgi:hypothetical protein